MCKNPRKLYKFNRRKYRCFRKDPESIRKTKRVCGQNKKWNNVSHTCEQKVRVADDTDIEIATTIENLWCKVGMSY